MSLNAVAVELLIQKGGFEPQVALGIAEAIETTMKQAQFVTVPLLDTRIAQLDVKIERVRSELVRWVFVVMLGNVALNAIATALLHAFQK